MKKILVVITFLVSSLTGLYAQEPAFDFKNLKDKNDVRKAVEDFVESIETWQQHRTSRVYAQDVVDSTARLIKLLEADQASDPSLFRKLQRSASGAIEPILIGFNTQVEFHGVPDRASDILHDAIKADNPLLGVLTAALNEAENAQAKKAEEKRVQELVSQVRDNLYHFLYYYRSAGGLDGYIDREIKQAEDDDVLDQRSERSSYDNEVRMSKEEVQAGTRKGPPFSKTFDEYLQGDYGTATLVDTIDTKGIVARLNSTENGFVQLKAGDKVRVLMMVGHFFYSVTFGDTYYAVICTSDGKHALIPIANLKDIHHKEI